MLATGLMRGITVWCPPQHLYFFQSESRLATQVKVRGLILSVHSVLPGIAFSLDLIETTGQYGVAEVLLSSFMAAFIFSVFGAQPLCIAGVTGVFLTSLKTTCTHNSILRTDYGVEQDHLRYNRNNPRRTKLPSFHRMGVPLGRDLPLDYCSIEL